MEGVSEMHRHGSKLALGLALAMAVCGACGSGTFAATKDKVTLQLKWVAQAQFAGYYAAKEKGFYDAAGLDVTVKPGGPDIIPEQVVAGGGAQFGIDWLPSLLSAREQGTPLINIAQVYQYSGMREIAFKSTGIKTVNDLRGKKVAVWFGGNEFELLATLDKYHLNRDRDLTLVKQPFDMNLLLSHQVAAAAAMTYNEYHQVLEAGVKPADLVVIDFNKEGTAMLEDGIFSTEPWLKDAHNKEIAARVLRAGFQGWAFCRDHPADCVDMVLKQDTTGVMSKQHQSTMMAEVNKLIWGPPAPAHGTGYMEPAAFKRTAEIALRFGVIKKPASDNAYTHAIWEMAQQIK
jgi:NitT/TauT family transport system substrate-binding protein